MGELIIGVIGFFIGGASTWGAYKFFQSQTLSDIKELRKDVDAQMAKVEIIANNQLKKITDIGHLTERFNEFREDHIKEVNGIKVTLDKNTVAITELNTTLKFLIDNISKFKN